MVLACHEHYTVDDYQQWKGDWELIGGMPYAMTPSLTVTHQICAANLLHQTKSGLEETSECHRCHVLIPAPSTSIPDQCADLSKIRFVVLSCVGSV